MPPGGGNGNPPGIPGIGGPLPLGEAAGGKGGKGGMPRPPGGGTKPGGGAPGPPGPGMKGGGGIPAVKREGGLLAHVVRGILATAREWGGVPGKPNGGGGKPCPPMGGPPCGASMGFAPAWPSAAYEDVMESMTD